LTNTTDIKYGKSALQIVFKEEIDTVKSEQLTVQPWSQRSPTDRRSEMQDRRNEIPAANMPFIGLERREQNERRKQTERRAGWMKINQWQSMSVFDN